VCVKCSGGGGDATAAAAGATGEKPPRAETMEPDVARAMRYAALWANAFPASSYAAADEPVPVPLPAAEVLAATQRLEAALAASLLPATELLGDPIGMQNLLAILEMHEWPVRPNSCYELCSRLWTMHTDQHSEIQMPGLWAAGEVPLAAGEVPLAAGEVPLAAGEVPLAAGEVPLGAGSAGAHRWYGERETARSGLYAAYTAVLGAAVRTGVELVGMSRAALAEFIRRTSPTRVVDIELLLQALIGELYFAWRRFGSERRARLDCADDDDDDDDVE
jgi:hypothetical protein